MGTWAPKPVLLLPNQRWGPNFVHDQMTSRRRLRVRGRDGRRDPGAPGSGAGDPHFCAQGRARVDGIDRPAWHAGNDRQHNGTELTSNAVPAWCGEIGVGQC